MSVLEALGTCFVNTGTNSVYQHSKLLAVLRPHQWCIRVLQKVISVRMCWSRDGGSDRNEGGVGDGDGDGDGEGDKDGDGEGD